MSLPPVSRRLVALTGAFCALLFPGTAFAHGAEGLKDTNYRVSITHQPDIAEVEVTVVEAGARLELRNTGDQNIEILGYSQEPYAELRPTGAFVNDNSPATYRNETTDADTADADGASPALAPQWTKVSDEPVLRWHDHRAGWMNERPPPAVAADPDRDRRVLEWDVPLRVGTHIEQVSGTVDWVAPPKPATWWAVTLLLAGGSLALLLTRNDLRIAAAAVGVLGLTALADTVGRSITSADSQTGLLGVLVNAHGWQALAGLAALAAAGYTFRRGAAADLALGIAAAVLGLLWGVARLSSFSYAITPTPWDSTFSRVVTVMVLGIGAGVVVGCLARMRGSSTPGESGPGPSKSTI